MITLLADQLPDCERKVYELPNFASYYLYCDKTLCARIEEFGLELATSFTHLELVLLLLALDDEDDCPALLLLGKSLTINKFEELL